MGEHSASPTRVASGRCCRGRRHPPPARPSPGRASRSCRQSVLYPEVLAFVVLVSPCLEFSCVYIWGKPMSINGFWKDDIDRYLFLRFIINVITIIIIILSLSSSPPSPFLYPAAFHRFLSHYPQKTQQPVLIQHPRPCPSWPSLKASPPC